jgi:hypothetical protein
VSGSVRYGRGQQGGCEKSKTLIHGNLHYGFSAALLQYPRRRYLLVNQKRGYYYGAYGR